MKRKNNGGFSLVEVMVAMAILTAIVVPICTGMLVSIRIHAKAETVMDAQVAVSSAVETLMSTGIPAGSEGFTNVYDGVTVKVTPVEGAPYYNVEAWYTHDGDTLAEVTTVIRAVREAGGTS